MAALELLRPRAELVRVHVFFSTTLLRSSRCRREGFGSQDQFHGWAVMSLLLARLEKSCSTKKVIPCLTACDLDCTSYMWPTFKNASSSGLAWPPTSRCFGVLLRACWQVRSVINCMLICVAPILHVHVFVFSPMKLHVKTLTPVLIRERNLIKILTT
jgi:hypothetical protein